MRSCISFAFFLLFVVIHGQPNCETPPMPGQECPSTGWQTIGLQDIQDIFKYIGLNCNILPTSQSVSFTPGGFSPANKRNYQEEDPLKVFLEVNKNRTKAMTFSQLMLKFQEVVDLPRHDFSDVNHNLVNTSEFQSTMIDVLYRNQTRNCSHVQDMNEMLNGGNGMSYGDSVANSTASSKKRQQSPSNGYLVGVLGNYMRFNAMIGDSICGTYFHNSTSDGYVSGVPYAYAVTINDMQILYPMNQVQSYATDLEVESSCTCHCAYSPASSCDQNTNRCGSHKVCANRYAPGINDWSCPSNILSDGAACCAVFVSKYTKRNAYKVQAPVAVNVDAFVHMFYANSEGIKWGRKTFSVPFSTTLLANDFNFQSQNDTNTNFAGFLSVDQIGNVFGYQGGDLLLEHTDGMKVATGWNDMFSTDVSKPGWLRFNNDNTFAYNKQGLMRNFEVGVSNCLDNHFKNKNSISRSVTDKLPTLADLGSFGDIEVDEDYKILRLTPKTEFSVHFEFLLNFTSVNVAQLGTLEGFSCKNMGMGTTKVAYKCKLTNFVGNSICFSLKNQNNRIEDVSCAVPVTDVVDISFYVSSNTNTNYTICANGYTELNCAKVRVYTGNSTSYDPSWVVTNGTVDNTPWHAPDWSFGSPSTWFGSIEDGIKTIFTWIAIVVAGVCLLFAAYYSVKVTTKAVGAIRKNRNYQYYKLKATEIKERRRKAEKKKAKKALKMKSVGLDPDDKRASFVGEPKQRNTVLSDIYSSDFDF